MASNDLCLVCLLSEYCSRVNVSIKVFTIHGLLMKLSFTIVFVHTALKTEAGYLCHTYQPNIFCFVSFFIEIKAAINQSWLSDINKDAGAEDVF